jgi:DNA ligase-1
MKSFGPLYAIASTGKIKVWKADVTDEGTIVTTHGYLDGAMTTGSKEVKGKNIGKSNETSPYEQACSEAQSKMNKKMDEGYKNSQAELESAPILKLPMLAHKFTEREHDIVWPAFVQPKLNGVRCLVDAACNYISRNGKVYQTLTHLDESVSKILSALGEPVELDGEVFNKDWNFQEITRAVKKYRPGTSEKLELWVFDYTNQELGFADRYARLREVFTSLGTVKGQMISVGNVNLVPTYAAKNRDHFMSWHEEFTKAGFEGTIARNKEGKYVYKHRSADLQKFKTFQDEEFKIVGGSEATGDDAGTVVFTCETDKGLRFNVRPKGSRETRREWFTNLNSIIGKELTIRYQELSEDGIPIFPVGVEIRDYE